MDLEMKVSIFDTLHTNKITERTLNRISNRCGQSLGSSRFFRSRRGEQRALSTVASPFSHLSQERRISALSGSPKTLKVNSSSSLCPKSCARFSRFPSSISRRAVGTRHFSHLPPKTISALQAPISCGGEDIILAVPESRRLHSGRLDSWTDEAHNRLTDTPT